MGTSITLNTVVRLMVWPQYPSNNYKVKLQLHYEDSGQVFGLVTVPQYHEEGKLDGHLHQNKHSSQVQGLVTVPNTNHMGRQGGTSINMKSGQVYGLITVPPYQSDG